MLFLASFPVSPVAATGEGKDQELQREMSTAEILEISTQLEKAKSNERALTQRCKEQEQQIATLRRKVLKLTKVMSQLHQGFARLPLPPTLHRYHCCCCWHCRRRSAIVALLWTLLNPWQWWVLVLCPDGPSWANQPHPIPCDISLRQASLSVGAPVDREMAIADVGGRPEKKYQQRVRCGAVQCLKRLALADLPFVLLSFCPVPQVPSTPAASEAQEGERKDPSEPAIGSGMCRRCFPVPFPLPPQSPTASAPQ